MVQGSDRINPRLNCLSCPIEVVGPVKDRSLDTTAAVMARDDDMANTQCCHSVRDAGDGVKVLSKVLIRDVAFGEKSTRGRREDGSFGNSGVTVWMVRCQC